jgi:Fic family protein
MKPPYDITQKILHLTSSISIKLGKIDANHLSRQSPRLRKENRIKTIHSSLKIEGNNLEEDQVTAILNHQKIVGPQKDITEVLNAIKTYDHLKRFHPFSEKSFLKAHGMIMKNLSDEAGMYRSGTVGIVKGNKVMHVAPPAGNARNLMRDLFSYLKNDDDLLLIKSCVFHYELEFIHPFSDGNGRMGRLWQTAILIKDFPVFEFLSFEKLIASTQEQYYKTLKICDLKGKSTDFIEYMLAILDKSLDDLLNYNNRPMKTEDRLDYFMSLGISKFSRLDYMNVFKDLSSATASRDLAKGIELKIFSKSGEKNKTKYSVIAQ